MYALAADRTHTPIIVENAHCDTRQPADTMPQWFFSLLRALNLKQTHRKCE